MLQIYVFLPICPSPKPIFYFREAPQNFLPPAKEHTILIYAPEKTGKAAQRKGKPALRMASGAKGRLRTFILLHFSPYSVNIHAPGIQKSKIYCPYLLRNT